jgi:MoaA/NifB/PqqE/SkfB family radical SAM enzyme
MIDGCRLRFAWLEITGRCQLSCDHCYASSGPAGSHGRMTMDDWLRVIDQAAGLGVDWVQFIGGEPTLYPGLASLIEHATSRALRVEVFSNLVHVGASLWPVFTACDVELATSWYSDDAAEHAAITGRQTRDRTLANIREALARSIPLRVGIIGVRQSQRAREAWALLETAGVTSIGYDDMRQIGRGARDRDGGVAELCGSCADGVLAISPSGDVWPCVFSRWLPAGNVIDQPLAEIAAGPALATIRNDLSEAFSERDRLGAACKPDCKPSCTPSRRCPPYYRIAGKLDS